MADDKKKQDDKPKKHAHGEGPVTDAKTHAEAKKPGGGGKKFMKIISLAPEVL